MKKRIRAMERNSGSLGRARERVEKAVTGLSNTFSSQIQMDPEKSARKIARYMEGKERNWDFDNCPPPTPSPDGPAVTSPAPEQPAPTMTPLPPPFAVPGSGAAAPAGVVTQGTPSQSGGSIQDTASGTRRTDGSSVGTEGSHPIDGVGTSNSIGAGDSTGSEAEAGEPSHSANSGAGSDRESNPFITVVPDDSSTDGGASTESGDGDSKGQTAGNGSADGKRDGDGGEEKTQGGSEGEGAGEDEGTTEGGEEGGGSLLNPLNWFFGANFFLHQSRETIYMTEVFRLLFPRAEARSEVCAPWQVPPLSRYYFLSRGRVRGKAFCKKYSQNQKDCEQSLKDLKRALERVQRAQNQLDNLKARLISLENELEDEEEERLLADDEDTEARGMCLDCFEDLRGAFAPSGWQRFGAGLTTALGMGLSIAGVREARRAGRSTNELLALQGFPAESYGADALLGAWTGMPWILQGLEGLSRKTASQYVCNPHLYNNPYTYNPYLY